MGNMQNENISKNGSWIAVLFFKWFKSVVKSRLDMVSAVAASNAYNVIAQTKAVAAPTVKTASSAPIAGVAVTVSALARSVVASAAVPSSIYNAISDFRAAQAAGNLANFGAVTISDSSAALTSTTLEALATMVDNGKIANITFSNPTPSLAFSRNDLTGPLQSPQNTNDKVLVLQKISSTFTLNLSDISISDALSTQAPISKSKLTFNVIDSAANISANIDQLEKLAKTKILKGITVSDITNPISIANSKIGKDATALKLIGGNYQMTVTGVLPSDVSNVLKNTKVSAIKIEDTMANIVKYKDILNTAATTGKLTDIAYTDTKTPIINIANGVFLMTLGASITSKNKVGYSVFDNTSNIIAHARYDIGDVIKHAMSVSASDSAARNISLADAITLNSLTNLAAKTKYNVADKGRVIATQAKTSNETILANANNVQIIKSFSIADASAVTGIKALDKGTKYSIDDTVTNILSQSAVRGDTILSKATAVNIVDTSANIFANLDQIQVLAKAGKIADITFTDNPTQAVQLSGNQVNTDAEAIGKITNQFYLLTDTINGAVLEATNYDGSAFVGALSTDNGWNAVIYQNRKLTNIGTLGGLSSWAYGISNNGSVVVGQADTTSASHAFIYSNGNITDLGTLGGSYSFANAISGDGSVIAGNSDTGNANHSFIYKNSTMTDLNSNFSVLGISNNGNFLVGQTTVGNSEHAAIFENGKVTDIRCLGGRSMWASGISNSGDVVTGYGYTTTKATHAFVFQNSQLSDIGTLGGDASWAYGVSADGSTIVGDALDANANDNLFVYKNSIIQNLGLYSQAESISGDGKTIIATDHNYYSYIVKLV